MENITINGIKSSIFRIPRRQQDIRARVGNTS